MKKTTRIISSIMLSLVMFVSTGFSVFADTSVTEVPKNETAVKEITNVSNDYKYDYTNDLSSNVQKLPEKVAQDEIIDVIVKLDSDSIVSAYSSTTGVKSVKDFEDTSKYAWVNDEIERTQSSFLAGLSRLNFGYEISDTFKNIMNGVTLEMNSSDFFTLEDYCESIGATAILSETYLAPKAEVVTNHVNVYETGIFDSSSVAYDGTNTLIAVLDSGFDYTHSAFKTQPEEFAFDRERIAGLLADTKAKEISPNLTVGDVYESDKIPFAYDYADKDADVYPLESEHGTHVAGIIAGEDDTITGVAPNAQLALLKVFSDVTEGAKESNILNALEDCIPLEVDVINMSLGTSCGFNREIDDAHINVIYDEIRNAGISLICAASNDYNSTFGSEANGNLPTTGNVDSATIGSPSSYDAALSVASISGVKTPYIEFGGSPIYFNEASNSGGKNYNFVNDMLGEDKEEATVEYVTITGFGRASNYTGVDIEGKVALVKRGQITFAEKIQFATEAGASGVVIYNNVSGDIKMNAGNDLKIGCVSISQEDGEKLAAKTSGSFKLSKKFLAGPFMSDFSSWGPLPSLEIKPEITAHGGDILSAVPGNDYDRLSGTSMASPNQAGVTAIVRQVVKEKYPDLSLQEVTALVNQLMMSTTDIAYNEIGTPYSIRKQGSGLGNLEKATTTQSVIKVKDKDGNFMDKTKLELGDDVEKTGVYEMVFTVENLSEGAVSYNASAMVMTEGVNSILTDMDKTTVTQKSYMLDSNVEVFVGESKTKTVNVPANSSVEVKVVVTLSNEDKKYLDKNFENGMYVEGYVMLEGVGEAVDINAPYLAFYGDWTKAPLFDLTYYETNPDEINVAIDDEDKTKPDAYATRPIGALTYDYISYLGSYYFVQDPADIQIPIKMEHTSISNNAEAINGINSVWAGLLRNARHMHIEIFDTVTGEMIFDEVKNDIMKCYSRGGGIGQSFIEVEFLLKDYELSNNTQYTARLTGLLDYGDGGLETNANNTFEFTFTTDYEAPIVEDVRYVNEYNKYSKETTLFAEVDIFDSHYTQAIRLAKVTKGETGLNLETFGDYMIPVYGDLNSTTTLKLDITDYVERFKDSYNKDTFVVIAYDYAMNTSYFEIPLPNAIESISFVDDENITLNEDQEQQITLSENQTLLFTPVVTPSDQLFQTLTITSSDINVVRFVDGKLVGVSKGEAVITATSPDDKLSASIKIVVLGEGDEGYRPHSKPIASVFEFISYDTIYAHHSESSSEREIGVTGQTTDFGGASFVNMFPSEILKLNYRLHAFFPEDVTIKFESSDESIACVTELGEVIALKLGACGITATVVQDGKDTIYSARLSVTVKDPYVTNGGYLTNYKGMGGLVNIPSKLNLIEISQYAFSTYDYRIKEEWEITDEDPYWMDPVYFGDKRNDTYEQTPLITNVVVPEGVEVIDAFAFAGLKGLKTIVLPSTLKQINNGAFLDCTSLETVYGLQNAKIISKDAFKGCSKLEKINNKGEFVLTNAIALGEGAFMGTAIEVVELPMVQSVGINAFADCKKLDEMIIESRVKLDAGAFSGCTSLEEITINAPVIPDSLFNGCTKLKTVNLGEDVSSIGSNAFYRTKLSEFNVAEGNSYFAVTEDKKMLLNNDRTTILSVIPSIELNNGHITIEDDNITTIGEGAFSSVRNLESIDLNNVTTIQNNAFNSLTLLKSVVAENLNYVGDFAFYNTDLSENAPALDSVSYIGEQAFALTKIENASIATNAQIGDHAFFNTTELTEVNIGDNVTIGYGAFQYAQSLTTVALGDETIIEGQAFLGCASLSNINLENVLSIGYLAFANAGLITGSEVNTAPQVTEITFNKIEYIGEYAFAGNEHLESITITSSFNTISDSTFYNAKNLKVLNANIEYVGETAFFGTQIEEFNFDQVKVIGALAFYNASFTEVNLSNVEEIGESAFMQNEDLLTVTLSQGAKVSDYAFCRSASLAEVVNLNKVTSFGKQSFMGTALTVADLTSANFVGQDAFAYSEVQSVIFGENIEFIAENPFTACEIEEYTTEVDGETVNTFDISEKYFVIDGVLYGYTANGSQILISYPVKKADTQYTVLSDTIKIARYAFSYNEYLKQVKLPYELEIIGTGAFFATNNLTFVEFQSIVAPKLEAEFDQNYIYAANEAGDDVANSYYALGLTEFFMWNIMYTKDGALVVDSSNFMYNNNFINYIGKATSEVDGVPQKTTLAYSYPKNGEDYTTFKYRHFFSYGVESKVQATMQTKNVIDLIDNLPEKIAYTDKEAVYLAEKAYLEIANKEQIALIVNYGVLEKAIKRIEQIEEMLKPTEPDDSSSSQVTEPSSSEEPSSSTSVSTSKDEGCGSNLGMTSIIAILLLAVVLISKKASKKEKA